MKNSTEWVFIQLVTMFCVSLKELLRRDNSNVSLLAFLSVFVNLSDNFACINHPGLFLAMGLLLSTYCKYKLIHLFILEAAWPSG